MFVSKKIARFISLFAFITATGAVYILLGKTAFAFPTPTPGSTESGKINIIVHVDPSDVTGVSVTATRDNTKDGLTNTMNFTQQSDKSWISDGITLGSGYTTCAPGHEGDFSFLIVAKKGNLKAQTDAAFCGHDVPGANVNYDFGTIKIPATAVDTGTITGHFTFINNAGKTKPFGVSTNATLKGGPDNSTYNLKVDKNGSVTFNGSIPVGTYTLKADYIPSGEDPDDGTSNQEILKDNLSIKKGSNDLSSQLANGNVSGSGGSGGDAAGADPNIDCPVTPNPLTWIMCPFINLMQGTVGHLDNAINALLNTNADQIFKTNCTTANADLCKTGIAYYKAWNVFRLFGIAFIIIGGLIMIAAQVAGFEILDAYALKKVMPRLVIAIIGISLSWYIMKFAVDATNEFGNGIRAIIYAPFISAHLSTIDVNAGSNFSLTLLGGAGLFALGLVAALSFVLTALLAVLVGFGILVLRKIIIIMLILMAPFAIALSILPNTRRAWVLWRETFVKLLLMYPIIAGFIAAGRVFALTASANASNGGGLGTLGTVQTIMAIVAYFAPYFLIATAFRLAGGAVATIGGMVNDRGRGAFDGLKKYRQRSRQQNMHDFARGQRFSEDGLVGKTFGKGVNATGRYGSSVAAKRGNFGFGKRGVAVRDGQQQLAAAELEKTNQMYAAYKEDDKVQHLLSLGSEAKAKAWIDQKDAAGNYIRDDASRTAHHASLAAARSIGFNSTTRRAAIMNGANISYGLGAGEEGWQEASRTMKEIAGVSGDATDEEASQNLAYRNMMNQFQYVAKGVGRADLSGGTDGGTIEYERDAVTGKPKEDAAGNKIPVRDAQGRMKRVGYDGDRAWKSVGLYQQANGKPASIKGSGKHYVEEFKSGQSSRMEEAAVFYAELDAMLPNATGGVRDEILRQKAALQAAGVDKPIGTTQVRELDPADPNKFIYATRDVSLVDRVRGRARTYERPDPNRPTP